MTSLYVINEWFNKGNDKKEGKGKETNQFEIILHWKLSGIKDKDRV